MLDRIRSRAARDEGLALVEFSLLAPLLALLVLGMLEMGTAWSDALSIQEAARTGARTAANAGDSAHADSAVINAVEAALNSQDAVTIDFIVVYDATLDAVVPPTCAAGASQTDVCNVYAGNAGHVAADFDEPTTCTTSPAAAFCPLDRDNSLAGGLDKIGVHIVATRAWTTALFPGDPMTIERSVVMQIDPEAS